MCKYTHAHVQLLFNWQLIFTEQLQVVLVTKCKILRVFSGRSFVTDWTPSLSPNPSSEGTSVTYSFVNVL